MGRVVFREAESTAELEQIHALNHRVFAEEIGQHHTQASRRLIDRFHERNRYFVAVRDGAVKGMISAHDGPEFSVTRRLPNPALLREFVRPVEVRLLAVEPGERSGTLLAGLLWQVFDYAVSQGFSHLVISGVEEREAMYRKLGFRALGPAVPDGAAKFIPMVMSVEEQMRSNRQRVEQHERRFKSGNAKTAPVSLMPGPVCIHPRVAAAFAVAPVSHRAPTFVARFEETRERLSSLMAGLAVTIFPGAGTLANDVVAANLKVIFGDRKGLVLSNGEFGERIARQATMAGLAFDHLRFAWGDAWSFPHVLEALERRPAWVWAVHLETSTGVLNNIDALLAYAGDAACAVGLDCVSSLGATRIADEAGSLLIASGVSGKSIGSFAGLAFVGLSETGRRLLRGKILCPSFDVVRMLETRGPVSTVPSPLLHALATALDLNFGSLGVTEVRFAEYARLGRTVRGELRRAGIAPLARECDAAPNITTFSLPSDSFAEDCLRAGYQIAHESGYLLTRGWSQIATMGDVSPAQLRALFDAIPTASTSLNRNNLLSHRT
jgi:aspartate aminotransferase-like enzyme